MTTCSKNGIKKEGESCSLNNNCTYPNCLEKNFTEKDIIDFAQFVAENAHFKNDGDWLYKSGIYSTKELLQKFLNSKQ